MGDTPLTLVTRRISSNPPTSLDRIYPMLGRVVTVLEMIKVVAVAFQSAFVAFDASERIENTGFRTV
jgi:hypothetical protein